MISVCEKDRNEVNASAIAIRVFIMSCCYTVLYNAFALTFKEVVNLLNGEEDLCNVLLCGEESD